MFQTVRFLDDHFASKGALIEFVAGYGLRAPNVPAVDKWWLRASVPSDWFPLLLALLELERGSPVSLTPYVILGDRRVRSRC